MKIYSAQLKGTTTVSTGSNVSLTGSFSGSIYGFNDTIQYSSSVSSDLSNLESKSASVDISISNINSVTTSNIARLSNLESKSASVDISISNINQYTGSNDTKWTTLTNVTSSLIAATGSYATTGSNSFYGTQVFSGSVYIANDLIVQGSSSIQYISASSVSIGTNIVQLNTATPSVRYAGLSVQDSGSSAGVTGSILWDSLCNRWIYSNPSTIGYSGGMLMSGPRTSTLGTESPLTCNYIAKSGGGDHLYDSCIIDDGTTTCIKNNLVGTGTACFGGQVCVSSLSSNAAITIQQRCFGGSAGLSIIGCTNSNYPNIGLSLQNTSNLVSQGVQIEGSIVSNTCGSETMNLDFYTKLNGTLTKKMIICANGNVGIGTISPSAKFHVATGANTDGIFLGRISSCTNKQGIFISADDSIGAYIAGGTNPDGTNTQCDGSGRIILEGGTTEGLQFQTSLAAASVAQSWCTRMVIKNNGNIGIGSTSPSALLDICHATNGYASVGLQGYGGACKWYLTSGISGTSIHTFSIGNSNDGTNSKLIINCSGNVGIGITDENPMANGGTYRNLLVGNGAGYAVFQGVSTATTADSTIVAFSGGTTGASNGKNGGSINLELDGTSTTNAIGRWVFYTRNSTSFAERMRISCNGYVGIGTCNPIDKLEVAGGIHTSGTAQNSKGGEAYFDYYSGGARIGLMGPDTSTNATFKIDSYRSNSTNGLAFLTINANGVMAKPNQMFVMGGIGGPDQSISTSNPTKLSFITNGGNSWYNQNVGSSWSNSTYSLTAPVTGIYLVNVSIYTSSYGINQIALYVNGSRKNSIPTGYGTAIAGGSAMVILQAGDTLDLRVFNDVGTITLYGNPYHSWFNIYFLG
jgi:hypothetical protein